MYIYTCVYVYVYMYIYVYIYIHTDWRVKLSERIRKKKRKMKKIRETIIGLLIIENHLSDILEKGYARVWIRVSMRIDCP